MSPAVVPFSQFVLKVASRCDLACDHCYVYQGADQSWRSQPMTMTDAVIEGTARRIAEHAGSHSVAEVQVVLHGGEPLLAGASRLALVASSLRRALAGVCDLDLRIHSNGVLLDEAFCEVFIAEQIKVGISVDGDQAANDRHRRYADGRGSFQQVARAIGLLRSSRYRELYAGLLCTIDTANDPISVYESLRDFDPPRVDFLLPHATWDEPPRRTPGVPHEYADWLIAIFDRWVADGCRFGVRIFDSVIDTLNGGGSSTEALGLAATEMVVIETNGAYEQADSLKTAFDGAPATGFNVFRDSLDAVAGHQGIAARQNGLAGLCRTCQECPVVASCGGGLYAHRWSSAAGFENPSVYCQDLIKLIGHIGDRIDELGAVRSASRPAGILADAEFHELAAGFGGQAAIEQLTGAQRGFARALLAAVITDTAGLSGRDVLGSPAPDTPIPDLDPAWDLIRAVDRSRPDILSEVLAHPYVRVWAVRCLDQLAAATADAAKDPSSLAADLGHLGAIAAAAGIRSGTDLLLHVPVIDGAVHLPTLGRLILGLDGPGHRAQAPVATAVVQMAGGLVHVRVAGLDWEIPAEEMLATSQESPAQDRPTGIRWQPARRLTAPGISVTLEDTDPYRDCHQWPAAPRLTDAEFATWQRVFQDAWQEIQLRHTAYAAGLAAGLGTVMPLSAAPAGREMSATARDAFGAVAIALPDDPVTMALLLIHEFQHVKLGAVLDVFELYDRADSRLFHAPWREDLRPLEGLLQGTYAHLAVSDFWRARQEPDGGPLAEAAGERYERWHAHTRDAIGTLAGSGSLTPLGAEFVREMGQSMARQPAAGSR